MVLRVYSGRPNSIISDQVGSKQTHFALLTHLFWKDTYATSCIYSNGLLGDVAFGSKMKAHMVQHVSWGLNCGLLQ